MEDDCHAFLLCSVAKEVWDRAPIIWSQLADLSSMMAFISSCLHIKNLPPTCITVPVWPWLLWNLWKARNKLCFEDKALSSMVILNKALPDAREWQNAQLLTEVLLPSGHRKLPPPVSPSPDTVVCHVYAAWDANSGNCGLGGIFSCHHSASRLPRLCEHRSLVSSALMAEALAVRLAVITAAFENIKRLLILSDSLTLINILKSKGSRPALFGIVFDIYHFGSYLDVIFFSHVPCLSNCEADGLAKSALTLSVVTSVGGD